MKRFTAWALFSLLMAVVLHGFAVWYLPRFSTSMIVRAISNRFPEWQVNTLGFAPLRSAGADPVVRDNPDTLTSFAVYDVSDQPVRVRCVVPEFDNYWSVAFFAWNTDTLFVVNDQTAPAKVFDVTIVSRSNVYQPLVDELTVVSPTDRGVLIVRMVVNDRNDPAEIDRLTRIQGRMYMEPIDGVLY